MLKIKQMLILFVLAVIFSVTAHAEYINKNAVLYKDQNQKESLGKIYVASQVKVLSQKGNVSEVEFTGFAPEDSPIVYEKAGVLVLGYEGSDFADYKVISKQVDEYDTEWFEVVIKGYISTDLLTQDKSKILQDGKTLFEARCGACHDIHHKEEFVPNVWPSILENMAPQAGLSEDEKMLIEKFLQEQ
ncbi:hypothetical protein [Halarcobacter ebronensis]|uniref:Cytochrome c domain-containing protein n=1 Tax=Halarcobacter ebronensis TaxID=1462615 RepID=A0A4V1M0T2_9BACT|nr:hypothetical protein [Halarcobacter ebronensis]QKF83439.1 hypothetical protein AEBR_2993 [Halarcobacter ebronensis]RXK08240.1 hypothetical protein CRV07_00065 [Halarcobacter ebronensis]